MINISEKNVDISIFLTVQSNKDYVVSFLENVIKYNTNKIEIICNIQENNFEVHKILAEYSSKYDNIKVRTENGSFSLKKLNGKYLLLFNSIDWLNLNKLGKLYEFADNKDLDILVCGYDNINDNGEIVDKTSIIYSDYKNLLNSIKETNTLSAVFNMPIYNNNLYKISFLEKNSIELPIKNNHDNIVFFFETMFSTSNIDVCNSTLFYKKECDLSTELINSNYTKFNDEEITINSKDLFSSMDALFEYFDKNNLYDLYKYDLLNYMMNLLRRITEYKLENSEEYFDYLHNFMKKCSKYYHSDLVLNLNIDNLTFYRNVLRIKTYDELKLLYLYQNLLVENGRLENKLTNSSKKINNQVQLTSEKKYLNTVETQQLIDKNKYLENKINEIYSSRSWKITEYFRKIGFYQTIIILIIIIIIIIFLLIYI